MILSRILSKDDLEWAGVKQCFTDFYDRVLQKLQEDEILSKNAEEHLQEIIDYIMIRLYKQIFTNNKD